MGFENSTRDNQVSASKCKVSGPRLQGVNRLQALEIIGAMGISPQRWASRKWGANRLEGEMAVFGGIFTGLIRRKVIWTG